MFSFAETAGRMEFVSERILQFRIVLHIDRTTFNIHSRWVSRSVLPKQSTISWQRWLLDVDVYCVEGEVVNKQKNTVDLVFCRF